MAQSHQYFFVRLLRNKILNTRTLLYLVGESITSGIYFFHFRPDGPTTFWRSP